MGVAVSSLDNGMYFQTRITLTRATDRDQDPWLQTPGRPLVSAFE